MSMVIPERTERKYEPYPEYKESGIEWLGEIPEKWEAFAIKRLEGNAAYVAQTGPFGAQLHASDYITEGIPLILIKHVYAWQIHEDSMPYIEPEKAEQLSMYRLEPNDIVFSRVGSIGRIALVSEKERGWLISGQMLRLRLHNKKIIPQFLIYLISSEAIISYLELTSLGSTRDSINTSILRKMPIVLPPIEEQQAITSFLDHEITRIDELIAKKQRLIDLLQEQRTALITQAVTKGLNPDAPMKDSGVEWMGEIPLHWGVKKLKHLCGRSAIYGANEAANSYSETGIRFLRTSDIDDNGGLLNDSPVYIDPTSVQDYRLINGDLLVSRSGTLGRSFLYDNKLHGECAYAGYLVRFVPNKKLVPKFAFYFTKSATFIDWLQVSVIQSTIGNVNGQKYANMPMPTPDVTEQQTIADYLDKEISGIDALVSRINQAIEKLQEYRSALITAAVTGKIDVRPQVS